MSREPVRVRLEPLAVELTVPRGAALADSLAGHEIEFPCGGSGICGGCGMRVLSGSLPATEADREAFSAGQLAQGWRLACQARVNEPLVLECGQWHMDVLADTHAMVAAGKHGLGIAIDLGTTTIAAQMIDLSSGDVLAVETGLNPQARFGSDVMSRIKSALAAEDLTAPIRAALRQTIERLAGGRENEIAEVVLVGNTVMHHLFCGRDVEPLSYAPFVPRFGAAEFFTPAQLEWPLAASCCIRFERCLGGFVGSDILAGMVATGMARSADLVALVDLGTNGEIAIGSRDGIVCASTAAGPAFEAGSIRMGMRAATGAISHVNLADDGMQASVVGDALPRGICGSGVVDVIAAGLAGGKILSSGRLADRGKELPVAGPVILYQSDIRELQLAKAAIASGFRLLLRRIGAGAKELKAIYLAGAFGNYVRIESAIAIGLIEAPKQMVHAVGNTALRGAKMMLLAESEPAMPEIDHFGLAADPGFQDEFAECMCFPDTGEIRV